MLICNLVRGWGPGKEIRDPEWIPRECPFWTNINTFPATSALFLPHLSSRLMGASVSVVAQRTLGPIVNPLYHIHGDDSLLLPGKVHKGKTNSGQAIYGF